LSICADAQLPLERHGSKPLGITDQLHLNDVVTILFADHFGLDDV
jgi:hypothetical protein